MSLQIAWYYNERHYGKGPMDGIRSSVNRVVFTYAKSNRSIVVPSPQSSHAQIRIRSSGPKNSEDPENPTLLNENSPQPKFLFFTSIVWGRMKHLLTNKFVVKVAATCAQLTVKNTVHIAKWSTRVLEMGNSFNAQFVLCGSRRIVFTNEEETS